MQYTVGALAEEGHDLLGGYYSLLFNFSTSYLALVLLSDKKEV